MACVALLDIASMRPQRFSCGIQSAQYSPRLSTICFNEAAAFQLRNPERNRHLLIRFRLLQ